ncbi:MAG: hypothetical protein WD669_03155 [Pirellulales bacterium]
MSSIASFTHLPIESLDGLRQATLQGGYAEYLKQHGRETAVYPWSGYVLGTLLVYLEEQQHVDMMKSEYDELATFLTESQQASHFIFTHAHRRAYFDNLLPENFTEAMLCDYYNDFNATNEPNAGQPMLDGIRALRQSLNALDESSVVLFCIG